MINLSLTAHCLAQGNWASTFDQSPGEVRIDAGKLHGVARGTLLALHNGQKKVGYAEVAEATALASIGHLISFHGKPQPTSQALVGRLTARVARSTIDLTLSVAVLPLTDNVDAENYKTGLEAIRSLETDDSSIRWVPSASSADVYTRFKNDMSFMRSTRRAAP